LNPLDIVPRYRTDSMSRALLLAAILVLVRAWPASTQVADPIAPHEEWRTVETEHFVVHYPAEAEEWTLPVVARLDSVHTAVVGLVGNAPPRRTTVVVADPFNVSNGFALPFLRAPTMVLWTTPPEPRGSIGEHRGWGELLAVHEYAHLAHLAWPSRNVRDRRLWGLLPVQLGPVTRRAPRWVIEGYATVVEGRLTGSGRPHGTWRPTTLRQWALEGRLPTYGQLSSWGAYQGGAMAYLAGSAFLEWLVDEHGVDRLEDVWRRMTAVQRRGFADAFTGVFGAPPDELYGRFTVELTREALEAERLLGEAGIVDGDLFQRLSGHTGDVTVSPDGERIALVLRTRGQPSRVVVWSADEPEPLVREEERERLLRRDPLDVPAIDWRPRSKTALATLQPFAGRPHDHPRFMPDGRHLLVTRSDPLPDGRRRGDLFLWDSERGTTRRITHGAGIRHPDPTPDGISAIAVRCAAGTCEVVSVDLSGGEIRTILGAAPDRVHYRPRVSPDGTRFAVAVQQGERWRVAVADIDGANLRYVDPDDGHNRYDAAWDTDGRLVMVSHRGGVANLERLDLETGTVSTLTRTTSAALAPAPHPDGSTFFLRLTTRGLDLHRLPAEAPIADGVVDLEARLVRVAPTRPAEPVDTFPAAAVPAARTYGVGPRYARLVPAGGWSAEGGQLAATVVSIDPVGRLSWTASAAWGDPGVWRGAGAAAAWRGSRPAVHGSAWYARQQPSRADAVGALATELDATYTGGAVWLANHSMGGRGASEWTIGMSAGMLDRDASPERAARHHAWLGSAGRMRFGSRTFLEPGARFAAAAGRTEGIAWQRAIAEADLRVGRGPVGARLRAAAGSVWGGPTAFEWFSVGGAEPIPFDPLLLQQRRPLGGIPTDAFMARSLLDVEGGLRFGEFEPSFRAVRDRHSERGWYRVLGVNREWTIGPAPLVRLPTVSIAAGVVYPLDEPFRHRLSGHLTARWIP
jgi:hypothetical protein